MMMFASNPQTSFYVFSLDLFYMENFQIETIILAWKSPIEWLEVFNQCLLNGSKVQVFSEKNTEKKHLCRHDKNYYYLCKSNIPVINLIVVCRNMIKVSKSMSW